MTAYKGPERREGLPFSDTERRHIQAMIDHAISGAMERYPVDSIAEKAAQKAAEKVTDGFYAQVGKSFINKLFFMLGVIIAGAFVWLKTKGFKGD